MTTPLEHAERCEHLPEGMRGAAEGLLRAAGGGGDMLGCATTLLDALDTLLKKEKLID